MAWKFNGFNLYAIYTLPTPPGTIAVKKREVVYEGIEDFIEGFKRQRELREFFTNFAKSLPNQQGWAPFVWGTELQPDWVEVP